MCRRRPRRAELGALLALALAASAAFATSDARIAAQVDELSISIDELDAGAGPVVQDIHRRLLEVARQAAQAIVERRLAADAKDARVELRLPGAAELETPLAPGRVIARVGSEPIRAAELEDAAALRMYRLRGELHLVRERQLDELIEHALLSREARRRGLTPSELETILAEESAVGDEELRSYVERQRAAGRTIDPRRARPYLEFRKRHELRAQVLARAREEADVRVHLRAPQRPSLPLDTRGGVELTGARGPPLVVFTNYRCELCRATHRELDRLARDALAPRIVLRDFVPAGDDAGADSAAIARCAARRGRLAPVRRALLEGDSPPDTEAIARLAGMQPQTLRTCMRSRSVRGQIAADTAAARRLGFDAPPAFIAAGEPLSGMQTATGLARALDPD